MCKLTIRDNDANFEKWPTFGKHEFIFTFSRIESSLKPSLPSSTIQDCGIFSPENSDNCSSEFKLFTEEELLAKDFGDDFEPLDQLTWDKCFYVQCLKSSPS